MVLLDILVLLSLLSHARPPYRGCLGMVTVVLCLLFLPTDCPEKEECILIEECFGSSPPHGSCIGVETRVLYIVQYNSASSSVPF